MVSEPIKSRPLDRVLQALEEHDGEIATCSVVWHELRYGAARLPAGKRRRAIEAYLEEAVRRALPILPYDEQAADWHGAERARLEKRGRPPTAADGQIAAIACVNDLVVVTANAKDFRRFRGLAVENWFSSRQGRAGPSGPNQSGLSEWSPAAVAKRQLVSPIRYARLLCHDAHMPRSRTYAFVEGQNAVTEL